MSRGPIGARVTMAVTRLVMQYWGEGYQSIMRISKLELDLYSQATLMTSDKLAKP